MTPGSPIRFPHLNLSRNPFGELTAEERGRLAVCELAKPLAWLRAARPGARVLEFLGPCGHGKSSYLLALRHQLRDHSNAIHWLGGRPVSLYYVPPRGPYPQVPAADWLVVDEIDRATWRMRRQLWRSGRLLAIGTHRSQTRQAHRRSVPLLTIAVANQRSAARLRTMLNRRIAASRALPARPVPQLSVEAAARLIDRFGDDIRDIEDYLYERFQQLTVQDDGEVRVDI